MNKRKLFALFAAMVFATSMWATDPFGSVDNAIGKAGSFYINGWAIDPDDANYSVQIHVYVFTSSMQADLTKAVKGVGGIYANLSRPDLDGGPGTYGAMYGTNHGFAATISLTDLNPGTYYIRVYALNNVSGQNNPNLTYSSDNAYVRQVTVGGSYTISYNANGGTGAPASQKKGQDVNLTLSNTVPTRTGYTFTGWNTAQNGSGTNYAKGAIYTANASVTLYAKWTLTNYTITYNLAGGSVSGNPTSYTMETNTITLNNPTRNGYAFAGWTGSNGSTPQMEVKIAKGSTGEKNFTANWLAALSVNKDASMAEGWTSSPAAVGAGQTLTVTYNGTKHVKAVSYLGVPTVTAPTAKTSLTYSGSAQALINAGSTTGGTMQYKVGNGEWGTAIPTATNAGTYDVSYRVQGNETYAGAEGSTLNVTIAKANPTITLSATSLSMTADDFSKDITVTRPGDGAITASSSNTTYAKPTVSGTTVTVHRAHGAAQSNVTITVNVAASANYNAGSKTCTYSQAVLRTPATSVAADKGRFLGIHGYLWKSKADAAYGSEPLVAVVAVVGSCTNYFDKCLCIALEDISSNRLSRADAGTALNTWAASHSVNVHGTVYNKDAGGYYDWAGASNYKIRDNSYGVGKGWRLPTICDWRYIMNSYLGWSLTNPAGVSHGVNPGLGQWSAVRTAINNATGGTAMKTDNNYGSATRADGNSNIGTWHCGNGGGGNVTWWWANDHDGYTYYYRAVFAY